LSYFGFEIPVAVAMKSATFWDLTPCNVEFTNVSEEDTASIFRIKEEGKKVTSKDQVAWRVFMLS
jgi:hypothetical protein